MLNVGQHTIVNVAITWPINNDDDDTNANDYNVDFDVVVLK